MSQNNEQVRSSTSTGYPAAHHVSLSGISLPAVSSFQQVEEAPSYGKSLIQRKEDQKDYLQMKPFEPQKGAVQLSTMTADIHLQGKSMLQRQPVEEELSLPEKAPFQLKRNDTGLPDNLKSGIESFSGYAMDDVKVHYNSDKPAQLQAHAYAQGTTIHIASGQEKHLPHEAWHVVQQKQGRVKPTMQMKGWGVNDDSALEKEASLMGEKALAGPVGRFNPVALSGSAPAGSSAQLPVQREVILKDVDNNIYEDSETNKEVGYLGKSGRNVHFFADYDGLLAFLEMHQNATEVVPGISTEMIVGNIRSIQDYNTSFGQIWQMDGDGNLKKVKPALLFLQQRLIEVANLGGPKYWEGGSSNRSPRAVGKLALEEGQSKEDLLKKVGVDPKDYAKYSDVKVLHRDAESLERIRQQVLHDQENVVTLDDAVYFSEQRLRRSKNARVRAASKYHKDDFGGRDMASLEESFKSLPQPGSEGWVSSFVTKGRGEGQAKAMNNWNALGAAAFANQFYGQKFDLSQNWEWLHIRASQIGGKTQGGNLVAGLYAVNSHMIPYENQIKKWEKEDVGKLRVRFYTEGAYLRVFAEKIIIDIATHGAHKSLGNIPDTSPIRVSFYTLTGKVVDKLASKIETVKLERQLQQNIGGSAVNNDRALLPAYRLYQEDAPARFLESFRNPVYQNIALTVVNNFASNPFASNTQAAFQQLLQFLPPTIVINISSERDEGVFAGTYSGQQSNTPVLLPLGPVPQPSLSLPPGPSLPGSDLPHYRIAVKGGRAGRPGAIPLAGEKRIRKKWSQSNKSRKNRKVQISVRYGGRVIKTFRTEDQPK
ncbi:DUF4157 domain-containing protein [Chitinophaga sp. MM2321]|uniref:eCIS core domain-containing protein n=1 Tax=Chitinophaga sp. MM2321 TaxID=3137178 RepID=UPI0032D57B6B